MIVPVNEFYSVNNGLNTFDIEAIKSPVTKKFFDRALDGLAEKFGREETKFYLEPVSFDYFVANALHIKRFKTANYNYGF